MKTFKRRAALAALALFAALVASAGPYPGTLPDHGHTGPGDGGKITNLDVVTRVSVKDSTMTALGFVVGTSTVSSVMTSTSVTSNVFYTNSYQNDGTGDHPLISIASDTSSNGLTFYLSNTATTGGGAGLYLKNPSSGTQDNWVRMDTGGYQWVLGVDNSDGHGFKIEQFAGGGSNFDTGHALLISTASAVAIKGTTNGDDAVSGDVGQYVESSITSFVNSSGTDVWIDVTNITLTAGDWNVSGCWQLRSNTATINFSKIAITSAAGNSTSGQVIGKNTLTVLPPTSAVDPGYCMSDIRVSIQNTTFYYLKFMHDYSAGGPPGALGTIRARRVR